MKIAFYAPMKSPDHPTPSGDRRMARLLMQALRLAGHETEAVSDLRVFDGKGDPGRQQALFEAAEAELDRVTERLAASGADLWFTYHCYYKAPDLLGPRAAKSLGIPYAIAEASRASKRLVGPWQRFAVAAEAAMDAAQVLFAMGPQDRFALDRDRAGDQAIVDLPPFIDPGPEPQDKSPGDRLDLLTVAMMRGGVKLDSFRALSAALQHLDAPDWTLTIIGDGEARAQVERLFEPFGNRVVFAGEQHDEARLRQHYETADVFVWPGVGEAYGMVYLEAQAAGCPVVAEDHAGPRSVVAPTECLVPAGDAPAFASAIRRLAGTPAARGNARAHIIAKHSFEAVSGILRGALESAA